MIGAAPTTGSMFIAAILHPRGQLTTGTNQP